MPYHLEDSAWSPRRVLRENTSHCYEGALFAAAALRVIGYPPLLLDLEAEHDTDHVLAIYKVDGHWGAVAKSNFTGCRYREPVYRSLRELALSYFNIYFNLRGERTLRTFSRPVQMKRFDPLNWMSSEKPVWFVAEYLLTISHYPADHSRAGEAAASGGWAVVPGGVSGAGGEKRALTTGGTEVPRGKPSLVKNCFRGFVFRSCVIALESSLRLFCRPAALTLRTRLQLQRRHHLPHRRSNPSI